MSAVITVRGNAIRGVDISISSRKSVILSSHEAQHLESAIRAIRIAAKKDDLQFEEVYVS